MAADLVHGLARVGGRMHVEPAGGALLHETQAPGGGEAEDAAALAGVPRRHHNRHRLLQHCLHVVSHALLMHAPCCGSLTQRESR